MDYIIDASSVINLANAGALDHVIQLPGSRFFLSPLVIGECEITCAAKILELRDVGAVQFIDPNDVSAEVFLDLLEMHDLGQGETECLSLCLDNPFIFCCDDSRARHIGEQLLGNDRIVGSIRLLKLCVEFGILGPDMAFKFYEAMREAGGFLPDIDRYWFEH